MFFKKLKAVISKIGRLAPIAQWQVWYMFGSRDIKLRYKRSTLGPFWITLSMATRIYTMGFLYSHLFHSNIQEYLPYLAAGMIAWGFISSTAEELTQTFIEAGQYINNFNIAPIQYIYRVIYRNLVILLHNLIALVPMYLYYPSIFGYNFLNLLPVLLLVALSGIFYGSILGMLGVRYRDFSQIISNFLQVIFFLTPIMWMPNVIPPKYHLFVTLNPFAQLIGAIRSPLINQIPSNESWSILFVMLGLGLILNLVFYNKFKNRIVFWV